MGKVIKLFCWHQNFSPMGCLPLPRGYIHILNHEKDCIKFDFKDIFFNLQQMNEVTRHFCWHQNFVPWVAVCPCPWAIYMYKIMKKLYKISKKFFWNLQKMNEGTRSSCWHQNFIPKGLSAPAPGLYTCMKSWKKCIKSDFKEIFVLNLWQITEVTRDSSWHQNFVPWGCLPLTCGYIHLLNHEKIRINSEAEEILFQLAANDHSNYAFLLT